MDGAICDGEAIAETVVFLRHFEDLPDPRQRGKVMYPLAEVLLLCLLAVLAGAETITDIARFGDKTRVRRCITCACFWLPDSAPVAVV